MPISVYDVDWNHPAKTVRVYNDAGTWVPAKKVKAWSGTAWVLAWVHPVIGATLSLSKSGVALSETYSVTLNYLAGFPEGAEVTFRYTGYTSAKVYPTEGATTVSLSTSQGSSGTYAWYADVKTKGGNTSIGPITQSVATTNTTVTLTAPTWVLSSTLSGTGGSAVIQPGSFTAAVGTPALVSTLKIQLSYAGGAWTDYKTWTSPVAASQVHTILFNTTGAWKARAVVTQTNAAVIYSAEHAVTCYEKDLAVTANPTSPVEDSPITYQASGSGSSLAYSSATWQYTRPADAGVWKNYGTPNQSTLVWTPATVDDIQWRWQETFSDTSIIRSNHVRSIVAKAPIKTDSGSYGGVTGGTGLVNAMRAARTAGVPLWVYGTWSLALNEMYIPDGVVVVCQAGAKFNHTPVARFKNAAKWPATSMPSSCGDYNGGSFSWTGGEFNGGGDGIFTISHAPSFTITGATMYNYCTSTEDGHAIECNSSGGVDLGGASYTVQITGNTFHGVSQGQRSNTNDEPVHYDWAWQGSGCGGAEDHSMCANVRIASNTFHRHTTSYAFALCAIGGHRMSSASYGEMGNAGLANPSNGEPSQRHNSFMIEGNAIHAAVGGTGTSPNKGAIALWNLRDSIIRNNNFYSCTDSRLISGWDATKNLNSTGAGNVNLSISGNKHNSVAKTITMPASNTTGG